MGKYIYGGMDMRGEEADEYKADVIIAWNIVTPSEYPFGEPARFPELNKVPAPGRLGGPTIMPSVLNSVFLRDGTKLPFHHLAVNVGITTLVSADIAVYLDDDGKIIYDPKQAGECRNPPATFRFRVSAMTSF